MKGSRATRVVEGQKPDGNAPLGDREYALMFVLTPLDKFVGHRMSVSASLMGEGGDAGPERHDHRVSQQYLPVEAGLHSPSQVGSDPPLRFAALRIDAPKHVVCIAMSEEEHAMTKRSWAIVIVAAVVITTVGMLMANSRAKAAEVIAIGCLELEQDYRARTDGSRGALGTGVGVGDEFVLSGVMPAPGQTQAIDVTGDYRLTGKLEDNMIRQVGRKVEVVGKVKNDEADRSQAGKASDLPSLDVEVWHTYDDFCPAEPDAAPLAQ